MLESNSHSVKGYQKRFKKLVSVAGKIHKGKESGDRKSGECLQRGASCPTVLSEYHRKETSYLQHPTASYSLAASLLKQICVESRLTIAASRQKSSEIVLHFPSGQSEASRFAKNPNEGLVMQ